LLSQYLNYGCSSGKWQLKNACQELKLFVRWLCAFHLAVKSIQVTWSSRPQATETVILLVGSNT